MDIIKSFAFIVAGVFLLNFIITLRKKLNKFQDNLNKKPEVDNIYIEIVVSITFCWLMFILWTWINSKSLTPNNLGDFFAGTFAPILFLWVVFGIFLQKKEFSNAINEYKKSVKFLEKQSINTDIQHQNIWFDRNVDMLEKYINKINLDKIDDVKNLSDLNSKIISMTIQEFTQLIPELQDIIALDKYINDIFKKALKKDDIDESYKDAIIDLKKGYDILFHKNISGAQFILTKMYIYIYYANILFETNEDAIDDPEVINIKRYLNFIDHKTKTKIKEVIENENISLNLEYHDLTFIDSIDKFNYNTIKNII